MNRRDFLALFRGLAILPFVKLPGLPEVATNEVKETEEVCKLAEYGVFDNSGIFSGGKLLSRTVSPTTYTNGDSFQMTYTITFR